MPTLERLRAEDADRRHVMWQPCTTDYWIRKAAEAADLEHLPERDGRPAGNMSPHVLRHTRATHLLQDRKSPWAVANLLGDTVKTVLDVYGHHCPDFLDEIFGDVAPPQPLPDFLK